MKRLECEFEPEVLAAVIQSRWPARVDASLLEHVEHCEICSDAAAVAAAIDEDRERMRGAVVVPPAGRVWWMAAMRARREAAEAAARPITAAQVIALVVAVGLLGACFGATSGWFQSLLADFVAWLPTASALIAEHTALAAAGAVLLLVAPTAAFLAIRKM